ncbi:LytR/AlgR family response regulator transcription factor [Pedobacter punctiformis]|uniref:LytTR family transcriptional regulator DNA-binding domain-containing protein n=1 Tax=Pedobacter punctiformis TaxID=3004097 RepID=A0ABT4L8G9_9SPHI|nr:LytTR family transcriptional regulator DNA-binding domain-containing protein [Pedobacter sp. HCMS5-2]MCZ4244205.1 LytTR family transcriptional regulator DNA-binding domain-containing protein [Pedobacter sp. HCMS5-2]
MNIKLRCAIIDRDQDSVKDLATLIKFHPLLSLVKTYNNPEKAFSEINKDIPIHLLFINIEVPGHSELEFQERLGNQVQVIIFTTSGLTYTLKNDTQYLVKPIDNFKFTQIIYKLTRTYKVKSDDNLFIEREKKGNFDRVIKAHILLIQNEGDAILIVTQTKNIIAHVDFSEALKELKNDLRFLQVHDSYLVNLNYITNISGNEMKLENGTTITLKSVYKKLI